jgi:hypothetical protein
MKQSLARTTERGLREREERGGKPVVGGYNRFIGVAPSTAGWTDSRVQQPFWTMVGCGGVDNGGGGILLKILISNNYFWKIMKKKYKKFPTWWSAFARWRGLVFCSSPPSLKPVYSSYLLRELIHLLWHPKIPSLKSLSNLN